MENVYFLALELIDSSARVGRPTKVSDVVLDFIDVWSEKPLLKFQSELRRQDRDES
jgi:hypothetical protein